MPDGSIRPFAPEILMYRITEPQLILEESFLLDWLPSNAVWVSDTCLLVDLFEENEKTGEAFPRGKASVVLKNGKWMMHTPDAFK